MFRIRKADSQTDADYHRYCETLVDLVTSPAVLKAALQRSGIADLRCIRAQKDPINWLISVMKADKPRYSKILRIEATGLDALDIDTEEARTLVDAVAQAYLADVVNREKRDLLERRDALERKYNENMAGVRAMLDAYNDLVKSLGTADSEELKTRGSLLVGQLNSLREQILRLEIDKLAVETGIGVAEKLRDKPDPKLTARLEVLNEQIARIGKEFDRVREEVLEFGAANADLMARKQEIDQLMKVTDQMAVLLNATEIDVSMPDRIELLGVEVVGPEGLNMDQLESAQPSPSP